MLETSKYAFELKGETRSKLEMLCEDNAMKALHGVIFKPVESESSVYVLKKKSQIPVDTLQLSMNDQIMRDV